jgi:hypothetical protein
LHDQLKVVLDHVDKAAVRLEQSDAEEEEVEEMER